MHHEGGAASSVVIHGWFEVVWLLDTLLIEQTFLRGYDLLGTVSVFIYYVQRTCDYFEYYLKCSIRLI